MVPPLIVLDISPRSRWYDGGCEWHECGGKKNPYQKTVFCNSDLLLLHPPLTWELITKIIISFFLRIPCAIKPLGSYEVWVVPLPPKLNEEWQATERMSSQGQPGAISTS
ncbi:hypothetical protein TNCT_366651 [Trichonephila clavata]|uniref:Uncharacterized protein n=1 Tax=Trichonephila clavata TaxID=2740835 RepID=A0A8X6IRN0_TRICU|nr:hypothetical protein TNCT_366651 [Trichonephila clavata]